MTSSCNFRTQQKVENFANYSRSFILKKYFPYGSIDRKIDVDHAPFPEKSMASHDKSGAKILKEKKKWEFKNSFACKVNFFCYLYNIYTFLEGWKDGFFI